MSTIIAPIGAVVVVVVDLFSLSDRPSLPGETVSVITFVVTADGVVVGVSVLGSLSVGKLGRYAVFGNTACFTIALVRVPLFSFIFFTTIDSSFTLLLSNLSVCPEQLLSSLTVSSLTVMSSIFLDDSNAEPSLLSSF